jgi:hypothetical protein
MDERGKEKEILFEDALQRNAITEEFEISKTAFIMWADENLMELIKKVPGVIKVQLVDSSTRYHVIIDARYNLEFIKKEVEAEILCRG